MQCTEYVLQHILMSEKTHLEYNAVKKSKLEISLLHTP